ncbi:hypothetical protein [Bartonella sp. HY038]|uniref:hypothetical protein n=1 Tax=Bartonella sp. HY038 TaxID=2759660 RepID=UPI0015F83249|nr:hypothetical protein [Bartonella sp. HY038]
MGRTNPEPEDEALPIPDKVSSDNRINFFTEFAFTDQLPHAAIEEMMLLLPRGDAIFKRFLSWWNEPLHKISEQEASNFLRTQLSLGQKLGFDVSSPDQPIEIIRGSDVEISVAFKNAYDPFDNITDETYHRVLQSSGEFGWLAHSFLSEPLYMAAGCHYSIGHWICQPLQANESGIDITEAPYRLARGGWMCGQSQDGIFLYDTRLEQPSNND